MKDSSVPTLLFVVDGEHQTKQKPGCVLPAADPRRIPGDKDGYLWEELPKCYAEQPHLLNHSSAQFYFQKKVLFMAFGQANLKHLHVRRKGNGWALGYRILIRSSIAGILYNLESGDLFYKWEVKVKGYIMEQNFINNLLGSVMSGFMERAGGARSNWLEWELESSLTYSFSPPSHFWQSIFQPYSAGFFFCLHLGQTVLAGARESR